MCACQCIVHHSSITADNFDVQAVSVRRENGTLSVTCLFAQGTSALGCYVEIVFRSGEVLSRNVSLSDGLRATALFSKLNLGNFSISVFDWEFDGAVNKVYYREFEESLDNGHGRVTTGTTHYFSATAHNQTKVYGSEEQLPMAAGISTNRRTS